MMEIRKEANDPENHIIGFYIDWELPDNRRSDFVAYIVNRDSGYKVDLFGSSSNVHICYFIDQISEKWHDRLGYASMVDDEIVKQIEREVIEVYEIKTNSSPELALGSLDLDLVAAGEPGYAHPTTPKEQL